MDDDRNAPATKGDVADLRADMKAMEDRFSSEMKAMEDRLTESFRDIETKILNAFYGYTSSNDRRVGGLEGQEAVILSRLAILEARVTEMERRQISPPGQQP